ncbi:f-box domain protein [Apiospora hydei]|uniref:F-box domain protein n=1 Tax=Apiospora hydei TaxID=1337664 RepID=A0ABR1X8C9_9PEZI
MAQLPNEIYRQILSPLDLETLQACRLAGRSINQAATELLFRHVTLRVELAPPQSAISSLRFIQIATAPHLRPLVREVAIKTIVPSVAFSVGALHAAASNESQRILPKPFLHALPFLRVFSGLKSLEIGFSGTKTSQGAGPGLLVHECGPFASLVLETCLRCLTGVWSPGRQAWLQNQFLQAIQATDSPLSTNWPPLVTNFCAERMEATSLKIADLPVSLDVAVTDMLLSCKSLTNLQLRLASSAWESFHNLPRQLGDRFDYFQNLPKVWLPLP